MLIAVCCDRGSPGSTTVALALAAARGLPAVVVEADPYGGDLALRCRVDDRPLPATPTVLGMAAGRSQRLLTGAQSPDGQSGQPGWGRPQGSLDLWREGSHPLNRLVRVVPGFMTAEQGDSLSWPAAAATMTGQTVPVFADLGRIHVGSPSMPIAAAADALVTACRAERGSVVHLLGRLERLVPAIAERIGQPPVVVPIVVSPRRSGTRHAAQVAALLAETPAGPSIRGVGWLAWDPAGLSFLESGSEPWGWPLDRSPLMRSAREAMCLVGDAAGLDHAAHGRARRAGWAGSDSRSGPRRRSRLRRPRAQATTSSTTVEPGADQAARARDETPRGGLAASWSARSSWSVPRPSRTSSPLKAAEGLEPQPAREGINGNPVTGGPVGEGV